MGVQDLFSIADHSDRRSPSGANDDFVQFSMQFLHPQAGGCSHQNSYARKDSWHAEHCRNLVDELGPRGFDRSR